MSKHWTKGLIAVAIAAATLGGTGVEAKSVKAAAPAQVVMDNLAKYELKKDIELPVTVTAGGLSYTLEKILIFDTVSTAAQDLIKKYGYPKYPGPVAAHYKYFVWTKLTLENKGDVDIAATPKNDFAHQWSFTASDDEINGEGALKVLMPLTDYYHKKNSKEALWGYILKPGEKLTTYQAYVYGGQKLNFLKLNLDVNGNKADQNIATKVN